MKFRRFFARLMDWGFLYLFGVLLSLIFPVEVSDSFYLTYAIATPLLWAPLEAFLLHKWGTTLGKTLFGVVVRNTNGNKLTFKESLRRAFFYRPRPGVVTLASIGRLRLTLGVILTLACGATLFCGKDLSDAAVDFERSVTGEGWIQYASDDGRFTVQFPKKPVVETHEFAVPNSEKPLNMNEYTAKSDVIFSVSYLDLPKKWRIFSSSILLKGAMKVVLQHMEGAEMIGKKIVKHKNYPAMDFQMKQGENEIEGRLVLVGGTLYKLTVSYPPGAAREMQHEAFLNSFELKS